MKSDCHHTRSLRRPARVLAFTLLLVGAAALLPAAALAAPQHEGGAAAGAEAPHEQTTLQTVAKIANFAILAGALVYFLKDPITGYLASRTTQIRRDLVTASEMRADATAQLAEIDRKLQTLPAELAALKARGEQDVIAEQARIAQAAALERERLLEQTRREIDVRLRVARRELTAHAAQLAVNIAEQRIRKSITLDDQLRLVDRYAARLGEAR